MGWEVPLAILALIVLTVVSQALPADGTRQEGNFKATLQAAEHGDAAAQLVLGAMYDGGRGVAQDYAKARAWYQKAAEQGSVSAQFNLGVMYEVGQGVTQDFAKARAWYQKAAAQGYAGAQINLGVMCAKGQGGRKDYVRAYTWWVLSAEQGWKQAVKFRDLAAKEMTPAQLAEAKRLVAQWKRK